MRGDVCIKDVEHFNDKFKDLSHRFNNADIVDFDLKSLKAPPDYLRGDGETSYMKRKATFPSGRPPSGGFLL